MSVTAAVNIGDSVQEGLDAFFAFLPKLLGFLIILAIGYVVARVVKTIVTKALQAVGVDRALHSGSIGEHVNKVAPDVKPSSTIGSIAFWFLFLGAVAIAVSQLGIPALNNFIAAIGAYLPNVVAAVLIFVVAVAISGAVGALVARTMGDTPTGKVVGTVVPVLVMAIAGFMILNQLRIAPEIVTATYIALIGSAALALALAFGLGGRDVAARMLNDAYQSGQRNKEDVKQDFRQGADQAKQDAQKVADKAGSEGSEPGSSRFGRTAEPSTAQTTPVSVGPAVPPRGDGPVPPERLR